MDKNKLYITPETKVYDLLLEYPQLEDTLIELAPVFKKLKNPVLRKTIAKVTSLKQAATVGNVPLEKIINTLRKEAGQDSITVSSSESYPADAPKWFEKNKIIESLDARSIINSGGHPLDTVVKNVRSISAGAIYELITPFLPAPLIDKVEALGFQSWSTQTEPDLYKTYFLKN